jgi:hypothetical protein
MQSRCIFPWKAEPPREAGFPRGGAENAEKSCFFLVLRALRASARAFGFEPAQTRGIYVHVSAMPKNWVLRPQSMFLDFRV